MKEPWKQTFLKTDGKSVLIKVSLFGISWDQSSVGFFFDELSPQKRKVDDVFLRSSELGIFFSLGATQFEEQNTSKFPEVLIAKLNKLQKAI